MNFEEYLPTVHKRCKVLPHREHLAHMAMGVVGEFGEVCEMIKKHTIYGKELDRDKLLLEVGDIAWYVTGFALECDVPAHLMEVGAGFGSLLVLSGPDTELIVHLASSASLIAEELIEAEPVHAVELVVVLCEMLGILCKRFDLDIEEVLSRNDAKLAARYDKAFDAQQAIDRKDVASEAPCVCRTPADCAGPPCEQSIMGMVETPTSAFITATPIAAKWDGHGTARQSNTGPGPSPETEAFWDDKLRTLEKHNANDKDTPRMK